MIKDLALVIDGRTKKAGPYALFLALLLDSHLTAVSAIVDPYLASYAYGELRYDLIPSAEAEMRSSAYELVSQLKSEGSAQGIKVNSLSLDNFEEADFDKLNEIVRLFDLVIMEQTNAPEPEGSKRTIEFDRLRLRSTCSCRSSHSGAPREPEERSCGLGWQRAGGQGLGRRVAAPRKSEPRRAPQRR